MKSFFVAKTETVQIDEEHSIVVRKPTFEEQQSLLEKAAATGGGNDMVAGLVIRKLAPAMLIVEWAGPGFEGKAPSAELIKQLPAEVIKPVVDLCLQWITGKDEEQKKLSGAATS